MEWIFIIAIGFICLACPILILLYLEWMPWYVAVAFCVWLISCIGTIAFSKGKDKKWYERMTPSFVLTFIFTILFLSSMDTDHYMFDENIEVWVVAPALSLPSFYLIGILINEKWQMRQELKLQKYNNSVDEKINGKNAEIRKLEQSIRTQNAIMHFVDLMDFCGGDASQIKNNPKVSNIVNITSDIKRLQNEIVLLQKSKK